MTESKIEWCDRSDWNPLRGCTRVSPGCGGPGPHGGCYAEAIAARFSGPGQPFHGFAERTASGPRWTGKVELIEERLTAPLRWRKPARIFALSMSDLFHEAVPDEWIDRIFAVMAQCPQHQFLILTKRAERMRDYLSSHDIGARWALAGFKMQSDIIETPAGAVEWSRHGLRNVWLGVSAEDQRRADERIPALLDTPAAVRWVSYEPALGPLDLSSITAARRYGTMKLNALTGSSMTWRDDPLSVGPGLNWVVCGGESGPRARPFNIEWARSIIAQCRAASVACFVKQLGTVPFLNGRCAILRDRKGGDMAEWPEDLRVRQYP